MSTKTVQLCLLSILFFNSCSNAENKLKTKETTANKKTKPLVTFYAMGDAPYTPIEDTMLPKQIAQIPQDAEFVIHVGDIKGGAAPCDEAVYIKVSNMLKKSKAPLFIIPGDNEWNDCIKPDEAWKFWTQYFMRLDQHWQHKLPVFRQLEREENFSFVKNNVLFLGLNMVGGRIFDKEEWKQRHATDLKWVRHNLSRFGNDVSSMVIFIHAKPNKAHNDFFDPFMKDAKEFQKPILLLQGDGHRWIHDRPFKEKNILRIQVDQGLIAPPLKMTVTNDPSNPFQFDRRK